MYFPFLAPQSSFRQSRPLGRPTPLCPRQHSSQQHRIRSNVFGCESGLLQVWYSISHKSLSRLVSVSDALSSAAPPPSVGSSSMSSIMDTRLDDEYEAFNTLHSTLPKMHTLPNALFEDELEKNLMRSFPTAPRRKPKVHNFTRARPKTPNGIPSAVWRKQFAEVAHTFHPGSERRRVRSDAPATTTSTSFSRPSTSDDGSQTQQLQQRRKEWPVDGKLSTRRGAYNDGAPWTKSPCLARLVKEAEARERGRKPNPECTFRPDTSVDPKILKHINTSTPRPEDVFNKYKIHRYTHYDRPVAYTLESMKYVEKKPTVDLADSKHAWRTEIEPDEGKDGRGRAYGRALWEDAMKTRQLKQEKWDELIAPSLKKIQPFLGGASKTTDGGAEEEDDG